MAARGRSDSKLQKAKLVNIIQLITLANNARYSGQTGNIQTGNTQTGKAASNWLLAVEVDWVCLAVWLFDVRRRNANARAGGLSFRRKIVLLNTIKLAVPIASNF